MFQLGKSEGDIVRWDEDLIFNSFQGASTAVRKLYAISGSIYLIKQVGGNENE